MMTGRSWPGNRRKSHKKKNKKQIEYAHNKITLSGTEMKQERIKEGDKKETCNSDSLRKWPGLRP
jgi:hypothetical protein